MAAYDRHVGVFSPEGRIYETEYALKSVTLSPTSLALQYRDQLYLAVELDQKPLSTPHSKFYKISEELYAVASGYSSDISLVLTQMRTISLNHEFNFGSPITIHELSSQISNYMSNFGKQSSQEKAVMSRPFGCAFLLCGENKIFCIDAAGNAEEWKAKVIGAGGASGQEEVERLYGTKDGLEVVKEVMNSVVEESFDIAEIVSSNNNKFECKIVYSKK